MKKLIETLAKIHKIESKNIENDEILDKIINIEGDENEITKLSISVGKCQVVINTEDVLFIDGRGRSINLSELIDLDITVRQLSPVLVNEEIESL